MNLYYQNCKATFFFIAKLFFHQNLTLHYTILKQTVTSHESILSKLQIYVLFRQAVFSSKLHGLPDAASFKNDFFFLNGPICLIKGKRKEDKFAGFLSKF